jgi:hypothetical protein
VVERESDLIKKQQIDALNKWQRDADALSTLRYSCSVAIKTQFYLIQVLRSNHALCPY